MSITSDVTFSLDTHEQLKTVAHYLNLSSTALLYKVQVHELVSYTGMLSSSFQ
jgi:hypothetical protein